LRSSDTPRDAGRRTIPHETRRCSFLGQRPRLLLQFGLEKAAIARSARVFNNQ
jgi:hypothetical protein